MSGNKANSGSIVAVQKDRGQKRPRCTTEEFVEKARLVHGDLYDYSKVVYVKASMKVTITCKNHGDFEQTPNGHLDGKGCRTCATMRNAEKVIRACAEKFVPAAREKHGDKYDYSESVYISATDVLIIKCIVHGKFEQTPNSHLSGNGCKYCSGCYKSDTADFVRKAIIKHGDKFDYSQVIYVDVTTPVTIICKIHGEFSQSPNNHLNGQGCFKCGHNMTIFNTEQFKEEAKKVHGFKYCYSKSVYSKMGEKLTIRCETHGEFEQTPSNHITHKQGCQQCAGNYVSTLAEFVDKTKKIHGDKYLYGKVVYVNNHTKVLISCPEHGDFEQTPHNHLWGYGCVLCGKIASSEKQRKPIQEFIDESNAVHSFKYSYDKVDYVNARTEVTIVCPFHGEFQQIPDVHLKGCGCYKCAFSGYSKVQIQWLDFIASFHSIHIQHAANDGEFTIPETRYRADGYCKETNTIYEYHGDYWHGNPKKYNKDDMNQSSKKTFGELYDQTLKRENEIRALGYNLVVMWESDWLRINRCVRKLQQKIKNDK